MKVNAQTFVDSWTDGLYLSSDLEWDPREDVLLHQWRREGELFPNRSYSKIENFTLPSDFAGEYYIFLVTDDQGLTQDQDRSNNERIFQLSNGQEEEPILIQYPPQPDLQIDSLFVLGEPIAGQPITIVYEARNTSSIDMSRSWTDRLWLSSSPSVEIGRHKTYQ